MSYHRAVGHPTPPAMERPAVHDEHQRCTTPDCPDVAPRRRRVRRGASPGRGTWSSHFGFERGRRRRSLSESRCCGRPAGWDALGSGVRADRRSRMGVPDRRFEVCGELTVEAPGQLDRLSGGDQPPAAQQPGEAPWPGRTRCSRVVMTRQSSRPRAHLGTYGRGVTFAGNLEAVMTR